MTPINLNDDERAVLVELLIDTIEHDRFPLLPRIRLLRAILAKLGVGSAPAMPYEAPRPPSERSMVLAKKRRR